MSDFMKDIANEAKSIPPVEEPVVETKDDLNILQRSVSKQDSSKNITVEDTPIKKPAKTLSEEPVKNIQSLQEAQIVVEQLSANIARLEAQIGKVTELVESNTKKYPFPEGATATNHSTGQQIVFSRGQWWYLDAEE